MITGTVWGITLLIVGFLAALTGGQLLLGTLWSSRLDRSREALRARPLVSVLVGLVVTFLVVLAAVVLGQVKGGGELAMVVVLLAASILWILGLAVVSREVGDRMQSPAGAPWRAILRGAVTTGLSFALPFLGWLVLLPLVSAAGIGGVLLSSFAVPRTEAAPEVGTGTA